MNHNIETYEINWTTGESRRVDDKIARLHRRIEELERMMRQGWWEEPYLEHPLEAREMRTREAYDHAMMYSSSVRRVRCRVVREVV